MALPLVQLAESRRARQLRELRREPLRYEFLLKSCAFSLIRLRSGSQIQASAWNRKRCSRLPCRRSQRTCPAGSVRCASFAQQAAVLLFVLLACRSAICPTPTTAHSVSAATCARAALLQNKCVVAWLAICSSLRQNTEMESAPIRTDWRCSCERSFLIPLCCALHSVQMFTSLHLRHPLRSHYCRRRHVPQSAWLRSLRLVWTLLHDAERASVHAQGTQGLQ